MSPIYYENDRKILEAVKKANAEKTLNALNAALEEREENASLTKDALINLYNSKLLLDNADTTLMYQFDYSITSSIRNYINENSLDFNISQIIKDEKPFTAESANYIPMNVSRFNPTSLNNITDTNVKAIVMNIVQKVDTNQEIGNALNAFGMSSQLEFVRIKDDKTVVFFAVRKVNDTVEPMFVLSDVTASNISILADDKAKVDAFLKEEQVFKAKADKAAAKQEAKDKKAEKAKDEKKEVVEEAEVIDASKYFDLQYLNVNDVSVLNEAIQKIKSQLKSQEANLENTKFALVYNNADLMQFAASTKLQEQLNVMINKASKDLIYWWSSRQVDITNVNNEDLSTVEWNKDFFDLNSFSGIPNEQFADVQFMAKLVSRSKDAGILLEVLKPHMVSTFVVEAITPNGIVFAANSNVRGQQLKLYVMKTANNTLLANITIGTEYKHQCDDKCGCHAKAA